MIHKTDVDATIDEIHRTRVRLAEKFGGDIKAILEDARRRQAVSGRPTWRGNVGEQNDARETSAESVLNSRSTPRSP